MIKKIGQVVLGVSVAGGYLGWKFYKKSAFHDELKVELTEKCAAEKECLEAVSKHFDGCYEDHYSIGSKRKAGGLNTEKFLNCFNEKSGSTIFSAKGDDEPNDASPQPMEQPAEKQEGASKSSEGG